MYNGKLEVEAVNTIEFNLSHGKQKNLKRLKICAVINKEYE